MNCPRDAQPLQVTYKHGIEVDTCNTCHGIWLDRDELDKILKLSGGQVDKLPQQSAQDAPAASTGLGFSSIGGSSPGTNNLGGNDNAGFLGLLSDLFN